MSLSLVLTNYLFCGLAILILIPLLRSSKALIFDKGIPVFFVLVLILLKLLMPFEFTFTHTLASKTVLPIIKQIDNTYIFSNYSIGTLLSWIWLLITFLILICIFIKHKKIVKILSVVPAIQNTFINDIVLDISKKRNIKKIPKIIQVDIKTGPFIIGLFNPIIVLPYNLSKDSTRFILMHELEHYIHHHILLKACIEIITSIYWWNPISWIVRREIIRALELQADNNVIKDLPNNIKYSYLETLINLSKGIKDEHNENLALSFIHKNSLVQYRIRTILSTNYSLTSLKTYAYHTGLIITSLILLLFSFIFTFESYNITPALAEGSFSIDATSDYFILRSDKSYDLYIDGIYKLNIDSIPKDLSNLPIVNN